MNDQELAGGATADQWREACVKEANDGARRLEKLGREANAEIERLLERLARLEYVPMATEGPSSMFCPACGSVQGIDHAPDCWLAKELRR